MMPDAMQNALPDAGAERIADRTCPTHSKMLCTNVRTYGRTYGVVLSVAKDRLSYRTRAYDDLGILAGRAVLAPLAGGAA